MKLNMVFLYSRSTLRCLRTVESGHALSVIFVPGDRHLIVGLRSGNMLIVDIASGDILEQISAHQNELWSIALLPTLVKNIFLTIAIQFITCK
jgi:U3 small nucleolar RNA-associated protein 12